MIKLLILSNIFDDLFVKFVKDLKAVDFICDFYVIDGQQVNANLLSIFDEVIFDFENQAERFDLIYVLIDSQHPFGNILSECRKLPQEKLVFDICRCSLNIRNKEEEKIRSFLKETAFNVVVRNNCQLLKKDGSKIECNVLVCEDYFSFTYMPRCVFSDIVWFIKRNLAGPSVPNPPSYYINKLITAPIDDENAMHIANQILSIDKYNSYALVRNNLQYIRANNQLPDNLQKILSQDPLSWHVYFSLVPRLNDNSPLCVKLKSHVTHTCPTFFSTIKNKKRILIFISYKQRDLFVDLLLKYYLEKMGHEVFTRSIGIHPTNTILELLPDVVISGQKTTPYQINIAGFIKQRNIVSIVRRTVLFLAESAADCTLFAGSVGCGHLKPV